MTPVPIPNTAVKPLPPMILLSGKVGYRRLYEPDRVIPDQALFFSFFSQHAQKPCILYLSCLLHRSFPGFLLVT